MISKDEIVFKNPVIEEMLEKQRKEAVFRYEQNMDAARKHLNSLSLQELGEGIIAGYWYSLLVEMMMTTLPYRNWIDFSYDTLQNLPIVISALYQFQKKNGYDNDRNADVVAKSIGAVMYGLAINEHECKMIIERGKGCPLWADALHIYVKGEKKTDFLEPSLQTVKSSPFKVDGGYYFEMSPIIVAYKETTGINLADYGIGSILLS